MASHAVCDGVRAPPVHSKSSLNDLPAAAAAAGTGTATLAVALAASAGARRRFLVLVGSFYGRRSIARPNAYQAQIRIQKHTGNLLVS